MSHFNRDLNLAARGNPGVESRFERENNRLLTDVVADTTQALNASTPERALLEMAVRDLELAMHEGTDTAFAIRAVGQALSYARQAEQRMLAAYSLAEEGR
jgi:hypothetical protein